MTRGEAIKWFIRMKETPFVPLPQGAKEAIDMAIEALSAEAVSREAHYDAIVNRITDMEERGFVSVVRCKDCRFYNPIDENKPYPCGYGMYMCNKDDFCSYGERQCNYFGERREE